MSAKLKWASGWACSQKFVVMFIRRIGCGTSREREKASEWDEEWKRVNKG